MSQKGRGWAKYGINKWRKREIMNFCRQYPYWQKEREYGLHAVAMDGMSHTNQVSRPTEQQAIRNAELTYNINLVEQAIRDVCPGIYEAMLRNITEGIAFNYLDGTIPYGQAEFYSIRIEVYAKISERRGK